MEIVQATIKGVLIKAPKNEPYKSDRLVIECIRKVYKEGGFDEDLNSMFGTLAEPSFYEILPSDCKVDLEIRTIEYRDEYYCEQTFKNACFHRTKENPYHLPKWTTL